MRLRVDTTAFAKLLSDTERRQLPYAQARALNLTANDVQAEERRLLPQRFTIRNARTLKFFERMVKIERFDRATKTKQSVTVGISGPLQGGPGASNRAANLLARHEEGGTHFGFPFFLPAPGMRTASREIPRRLYPANLRLATRKTATSDLPALRRGKLRTFVIPNVGIFQRQSKDEIDSLWFFKTKITLHPRLMFVPTAERVVAERWVPNFAQAFAEALRTAR